MLREGTGLIVSPLIALMQDQVTALRELGIAAEFLNSSQSPDESARGDEPNFGRAGCSSCMSRRSAWSPSTPGRCCVTYRYRSSRSTRPTACRNGATIFASDYLGLGDLGALFPGVPRMAVTATATDKTREEIVARLELDEPDIFVAPFDRPNIGYAVQVKTRCPRATAEVPAGTSRRRRDRLLPVAQENREHRRLVVRTGIRGVAVPCRTRRRCACAKTSAAFSPRTAW